MLLPSYFPLLYHTVAHVNAIIAFEFFAPSYRLDHLYKIDLGNKIFYLHGSWQMHEDKHKQTPRVLHTRDPQCYQYAQVSI
jgi:hypothetical protein